MCLSGNGQAPWAREHGGAVRNTPILLLSLEAGSESMAGQLETPHLAPLLRDRVRNESKSCPPGSYRDQLLHYS